MIWDTKLQKFPAQIEIETICATKVQNVGWVSVCIQMEWILWKFLDTLKDKDKKIFC